MKGFISVREAAEMIHDGMTVMVGGFLGCGNPHLIIDELLKTDVKDLTIISDDSPRTGYGLAKLIDDHRVRKLITSHVGQNPNVAAQLAEGTIELELIPQGSLAEMVRAGGAGLGGIITPTGVNTVVEESPWTHSKINIDGRDYLIMKPLHADAAIISAYNVDKDGNAWMRGTTRNFNELMPMAADLVICEADNIVEVGEIAPENVMVQGLLIDYVAKGAPR